MGLKVQSEIRGFCPQNRAEMFWDKSRKSTHFGQPSISLQPTRIRTLHVQYFVNGNCVARENWKTAMPLTVK
jgi:hypothetical protein